MSQAIDGLGLLAMSAFFFVFTGRIVEWNAKHRASGSCSAAVGLLTGWTCGVFAALSGVILLLWAGGIPWMVLTHLNRWATAVIGVAILLGSRHLALLALDRYPDSSARWTRATPLFVGLVFLYVAWRVGGVAPLYPAI